MKNKRKRMIIINEESEDEGDDYSRKPVPILLSIILVIAYIIGGAFLFQMWEN